MAARNNSDVDVILAMIVEMMFAADPEPAEPPTAEELTDPVEPKAG